MDENKITSLPELTLDADPAPEAPMVAAAPVQEIRAAESSLSEEEKALVADFAKKIDLSNTTQILQYGSTAQKKMTGFSETALQNVRGKDMGEIGDMLTGLVVELKGFSAEDDQKGGLFGLFKKSGKKIEQMKARYDTVEKNVDKICDQLESHQITLMKDVAMLDEMYDRNLLYYKELTLYLMAGREKLNDVIQNELPALQEKAKMSGSPEDAQNANQLADMCNRFDKKLHDLDLTRTICLQMGPQIRLVQSNDSIMVEKIQSSLSNTIPLWKNQMVLALGLAHSENAIKAQRQVTDITNQLLRQNADTLKTSTVEAAKESERGIVDIETLKHTNEQLISTLDEVMQIQQEGREKRRMAETELQRIEGELKNKLLEVRDTSK
ncbi:toxic anion resistance protein [Oscillospiraceae bacterium OttesenSCG-928-F05]|nr:toxic anion resistance protein [Oscillospiraceae bacterium OttesenSCG-928-F05]